MIPPTDVMPDFLDGLETSLRATARSSRDRRFTYLRLVHPQRLAVVGAVVAATITAVLLSTALGGDDRQAYAKPLILSVTPTDVPARLQNGLALQLALGHPAVLDEARTIGTPAGDAYLVSGDEAWCLSVPDPASPHPTTEPGVTCTDTATFLRQGIALRVGRLYVAAVAPGTADRTLRHADGTTERLRPNEVGVVTASDLADKDSVLPSPAR